jgi:hypothetical protein
MREDIDPDTWNAIFTRANGKCECSDPSCRHPAGKCDNAIGNLAGIALPENTAPHQRVAVGRLMCASCFQRTPSFVRQRAP